MKIGIILETKEYEKAWTLFGSRLQQRNKDTK